MDLKVLNYQKWHRSLCFTLEPAFQFCAKLSPICSLVVVQQYYKLKKCTSHPIQMCFVYVLFTIVRAAQVGK